MPNTAYAIVALSTTTHAYWNYLFKRAGGGEIFVALSKVAEALLFAPFFFWLATPRLSAAPTSWVLVVGAAALVLANYAALSRAYAAGDLSLVYPVSRAGALLFLPWLGYLVFDERLSAFGILSMVLIVIGMILLQLPSIDLGAVSMLGVRLRSRPVVFALCAAFAAAIYTVWDKHAVNVIPAFTYFYAYTALVAVAYAFLLGARHERTRILDEWRRHRSAIVLVAVLNTTTYLLVLDALRTATSSYVIAMRQLSIAWGALLGRWLLDEPLGAPRYLGVAVLIVGCALVALAG